MLYIALLYTQRASRAGLARLWPHRIHGRMYHPSMRLKLLRLPDSGPLLGGGYLLLWLLL
jgi:hypothetical protein